jgi:hypothetical protein
MQLPNEIKEKAVKELIAKKEELSLLLVWDSSSLRFEVAVCDTQGNSSNLLTWKGTPKTFVDPTIAIRWAKEMGFYALSVKKIEFK